MPTEAIALSQPQAQLDPHFTLRPLRLDEDVAVIHPWYQMDYAHYWNMQDMTLEATRDFYADALGSGHMRAFMGFYRGAPAFVMECYDPRHDPLGKRYAVQPGDLGMHFFVGPSAQPIRHFTRDVLRAVMAFLFDELGARRVVVEPDIRNHKVHRLNRLVGFVEQGPVELPAKTALLAFCTPADFFQSLEGSSPL
ncbi:GNAT family N-acetyltransferase [Ectopseudomonas alcaliphila]|uniref:GNAT family N-acetyltransferase n=1 Tax=Ectopseudomonas alcaliphila TaxID=101564 RepID=A0A1G7LD83_9GAMM|nr:GNAT family N-acetyltransferase [Pseudomonas alcaliphila]MDX5995139.1 GNAT family N-acetyltransferase [Pseudomonas alcaliphila]SDF47351.1 Protein N-acetyltransferase, RimJ/RimL family [Pseudomonas alcaliphila]